MMSDNGTRPIPQREYRTMVDLINAHQQIHGDKLRATIAFGDILNNDHSYDIDLLEVVEGWKGQRLAAYASSEQLNLRGTLRLYFLTPEEFEDPNIIGNESERNWTKDLLRRVRSSHDILTSSPPAYAEKTLYSSGPLAFVSPPASGYLELNDPFTIQGQRR